MQPPTSQTNITMALFHESGPELSQINTQTLTATPGLSLHQALWIQHGSLRFNNKQHGAGDGFELLPSAQLSENTEATVLRFVCIVSPFNSKDINIDSLLFPSHSPSLQIKTIAKKTFVTPLSEAVLRFDRVDFPPTAIAYRHTHPGGGFRYLTLGSLTLHTDHDVQTMSPGKAWFEPANSPVKAVADTDQSSQFIRMLLLPPEFKNRSSFTLCDQSDADLPRLQTTHRFFDKKITLVDC